MANKRLPGGRKSAGRISTSAKKLVALKSGSAGVAISELPDTEKLTGKEFFPVVQDNETRKVPLEELSTLISVDGINAQGGNFCLSPVAYRLANSQGSPTTFKAEYLNEAISITYRIYFGTNGYLRLDFSKWDFDFNESQNYKIILTNNSSGEFSIVAPGNGLVINNDGTVGEPEVFKIDTKVTIIEITQSSHDSKLILRRLTPYEPGKDGESAYSFWAGKQPEGADISDEAFLKFMEGKEGEPGKSAYQLWLDEGNEGSEADYLEWQKASISVDGIEPIKGGGVTLTQKSKVVIVSNDEVIKPDLNKFINLNYYIVANNCTVTFDLSEWDMQFHELQNIRFSAFANGTGYVTFITPLETMYRLDGSYGVPEIITVKRDTRIFQITQDPYGSHLRVNQVGPIANGSAGASAYDIWAAAQPDGKDTSEEAYLESMEGKKGDEGRSAYQIWLDAGNEGTEDDFLNWLSKAADINLDASPKNILSQTEDGLLVDGTHPVIPKYSDVSSWQVFPEPEEIPGGYFVYSRVLTVKNPVGAILVNDWPIFKLVRGNIGGLYYDADDNLLDVRCVPVKWIVSNKKIDITFHVIMSGKPHKSLSLYSLVEDGNEDEGTLYLKLEAQVLTGVTLNQLGME
ncbi:hypothetical protein ACMWRF_000452 [Enterobacter hormaechei]|nr:hypothetical protein [Enterobacter hormaechei]